MDLRLKKLAKLIVEYSTRVKEKDNVVIMCEEISLPYMKEVAKMCISKGAYVHTVVELPDIERYLYNNGSDNQLDKCDEHLKYVAEKADVWITAWGTDNTRSNSNVNPNKIKRQKLANKEIMKVINDRIATGSIRWCGTQYPTNAEAQEANMSLEEYEDFVYGSGLLDLDDPVKEWEKIRAEQERWIEYLDTKKEIRIVSKGTDIVVNVEGRKWINCCGNENFPDGEIFTSPVEDKINGYITFSFPGIYAGKEIEDIYLRVENGLIVESSAKKGEELLKELINTDEGSKFFGEVAIGTNYNITKFTKNMLFDEKIGGTVHMAIGNAMGEAGGTNSSAIHWDMLCDMRQEGKIYADGVLFYENGKLLENILK